jgi:dolichol-phosphate mannosyltransferase
MAIWKGGFCYKIDYRSIINCHICPQFAILLPSPTGDLYIHPSDGTSNREISLSLVIPTYQESKNIAAIVELLSKNLDRVIPNGYELIVVDDDSPDRTWEVAADLLSQYPQLKVMRRVTERGLATAVIRGWQAARGEILGVIDADLQHPPEVLLELWGYVDNGADLAIASRNVEGGGVSEWSLLRRCLSRGAQLLGLIILPEVIGRVTDPMSGYFCLKRSAIAGRRLSPLGYKILIETIGRGDIKSIAEVGYEFQERQAGASKVTWRQYIEYIQHLIGLRIDRSQRFIRFITVGLSGLFVDMLVLYLLTDLTTLDLPLPPSKIAAAEVAIINNFLWNDRWTFGDLSRSQPRRRQKLKRFLKFNLVCLMGVILNVIILTAIYNNIIRNQYIANFIAIVLVTLWNFWLNLKLSWRVTDRR